MLDALIKRNEYAHRVISIWDFLGWEIGRKGDFRQYLFTICVNFFTEYMTS